MEGTWVMTANCDSAALALQVRVLSLARAGHEAALACHWGGGTRPHAYAFDLMGDGALCPLLAGFYLKLHARHA